MPAAIAKRRFNTAEYESDFRDLIKANPDLAAKSATKLARRKRNAENNVADAEDATQALAATLGTLVVMAGAGAWQGMMRAKRDALIADWEMQGASTVGADVTESPDPWSHERGARDPMYWGFFPKMLILPIALAGVTAIAASRRSKNQRIGTLERTANMAAGATFGLFVADMVGSMTYKSSVEKLASNTDLTSIRELPQAV